MRITSVTKAARPFQSAIGAKRTRLSLRALGAGAGAKKYSGSTSQSARAEIPPACKLTHGCPVAALTWSTCQKTCKSWPQFTGFGDI
jgi:hypothetical protein